MFKNCPKLKLKPHAGGVCHVKFSSRGSCWPGLDKCRHLGRWTRQQCRVVWCPGGIRHKKERVQKSSGNVTTWRVLWVPPVVTVNCTEVQRYRGTEVQRYRSTEQKGPWECENLKGALSATSCHCEFSHWHWHRLVGDHLIFLAVLEDSSLNFRF